MLQPTGSSAWRLARRQHGVLTRGQLLELGYSPKAIEHRLAAGRLHAIHAGVYAVGRPELTQRGSWMAATLCCGRSAFLSHVSAGALWGVVEQRAGPTDVSIPSRARRNRPSIRLHRRGSWTERDRTTRDGIPVTTPITTLIDLATALSQAELERAIGEADQRGLTSVPALRSALDDLGRRPGIGLLRALLDRQAFRLTDSELERRFLAIVRRAGLAAPRTRARVNGFRVDFHWADLGLVVETDGLTYHRTAAQQARDRVRDQTHAANGLTCLRFTHAQIARSPERVARILAAVAERLG